MPGTAVSIRAVCATAVMLIALGLACPSHSAAQTPTPTPGGPCCEIHAGPGCDDAVCEDCVCGRDPVCCMHGPIGWDAACAGTQTVLCPDECGCSITPAPTPTPGGPCCTARDPEVGGTGCDVPECEACVCGRDEACCNNVWDATCVLEAREECATAMCGCAPVPTETPAPTPTPGGDCCAAHDGPSCDVSECRTCVCALDDECCMGVWDATCVDEARIDCVVECPCESIGDCCEPHGGVGCDDAPCKNCVCDLDSACCDPELGWDENCVSEATVECAASCLCEEAGSCCEEHLDTIGCDDRRCQECVCTFDEPCCTEGWDQRCADEAATDCHERCMGCGLSDCCDIREGPGCATDACEACVCDIDDFCCNPDTGVWDGACVDLAFESCGSTCQCEVGSACPGDCDNSDSVGINELISCVNIALGSAPESTCPACDRAGDGVAINDLIAAVNAAQNGCP
jgi:hypothetical protein